MVSGDLASSLEQWTQILGPEFVDLSPGSIAAAETATFATEQRITAILRPANKEQIQECLRVSNRYASPLYPISSGKNWGYGSRVPPVGGCALLDLSRLNRILDFSEHLGYVTVEPGVTQQQLYDFLQLRRSRLWMDATGSSPFCSLIGNVMERGFGHTPLGDHFAHVCGLEVILPNGDIIETGSGRFPHSTTAPVNKWGLGPSLDGLFSQSNFGIVTRMTVWLMPEPEAFEAFFYRCPEPDGIVSIIDSLRDLRLRDILRSAVHIGNDYKVLAGLQQYPWDQAGQATPLSLEHMAGFRKKLGFGCWNASGGLYGTKSVVAEAKGALRKTFARQSGTLKFLKPQTLQFAKRWAKPFKLFSGWDLNRTLELVEPVLGLMRGVPTRQPLASAYWRKRTPPPTDPDPDRDGCGLLWYAPVAPAEGAQVAKLTSLASRILLRFGFEPQVSLTLLTPRTAFCILSITYDRQVPGEDERASACYRQLSAECSEAGFYPYRIGTHGGVDLGETGPYESLLRTLKRALDPRGVLAPGRYEPEAGSSAPGDHRPERESLHK